MSQTVSSPDYGMIELRGLMKIFFRGLPAACVIATCKRCFAARNPLRVSGFCLTCERELDRWSAWSKL